VPVAGPIPNDLKIDIPGAIGGFPSFSDVSMPTAAPIEFTVDGTNLSWSGSGSEGGAVDITVSALVGGDVFGQTLISCKLVDDGEFTFAADLWPAGFVEFPLFSGTRSVSRVEQIGDAVLVLQASVERFLMR